MFLIVSGGDQPGRELMTGLAAEADMIIAADRGARYCLDGGITPDLVVGDMDSIDAQTSRKIAESDCEMKRYGTDKDRTDTEIALDEAIARGAKSIEIIGATGDRVDHTLANIHLLLRALSHGIEARISTDTQQIFLIDSQKSIRGCAGMTISFLPLSERVTGITLTGFRYALENSDMEIGRPYGISNVIESDVALVRMDRGYLLAVLTRV